MKKFKQFRKLGFSSLFFLLCMLAFMPANAQRLADADILTTHVDKEKGKMYVEMNFYAPSCGEHQVRFSFCNTGAAADTFFNGALVLDSVLTNQHSAGSPRIDTIIDNVAGSKGKDSIRTVLRLDNTAVGGYHLRFDVKDTALFHAGEKPQLCMDVTRLALHCKYCGVERTSLVLDPLTIDDACPYKYKDSILYGKDTMLFYEDLITCRKRNGSLAKNWEAFIQDPRDCRTYRIVQMPDSNWWFAQNLNFQSYPSNPKALYNSRANAFGKINRDVDTLLFWCPGPDSSLVADAREDTVNRWSCEAYGALYNSSKTLFRHDGYGAQLPVDAYQAFITNKTILDVRSTYILNNKRVRAVCPPEWFVPSDADWGIMLNAVEGCTYPDSSINDLNVTCNHVRTIIDTGKINGTGKTPGKGGVLNTLGILSNADMAFISFNLGQNAGRYLRATPTCANGAGNCDDAPNAIPPRGLIHTTNPDTAQAKTSWSFAGSNNAGTDQYGFSALPAGFLNKSSSDTDETTLHGYYGRGYHAIFLTSTFLRSSDPEIGGLYSPLARVISYNRNDVGLFYYQRHRTDAYKGTYYPSGTNAYSIRCIKMKTKN